MSVILGRSVVHVAARDSPPGSDIYGHGQQGFALCGFRGIVYNDALIDRLFPLEPECKRCKEKAWRADVPANKDTDE